MKAPGIRARGYDANKKLSSHRRHIAVDTDGRLLEINLKPADIAGLHWNTTGALAMGQLMAYNRRKLLDKAAFLKFTVEVVRRLEGP